MLSQTNYKVIDGGFIPYAGKMILRLINDLKNHNDSFYSVKRDFPNYDLCLGNYSDKIMIELLNEDLIKEFYANEGTKIQIKYQ